MPPYQSDAGTNGQAIALSHFFGQHGFLPNYVNLMGNINMHAFLVEEVDREHPTRKKAVMKEKATTCDLNRNQQEPACVYACPHSAAMRVNPVEFFGEQLGLRG